MRKFFFFLLLCVGWISGQCVEIEKSVSIESWSSLSIKVNVPGDIQVSKAEYEVGPTVLRIRAFGATQDLADEISIHLSSLGEESGQYIASIDPFPNATFFTSEEEFPSSSSSSLISSFHRRLPLALSLLTLSRSRMFGKYFLSILLKRI
jgi:hypothetical protein